MNLHRPNILLFMTDQQRYDSLGCYGASFAHSPNLDRLAATGVRFSHCYVNNTICTPSRASLMTGLSLPQHGVHQLYGRLDDRLPLFPEFLRSAGYRTALVGKLHVSDYKHEAKHRHPRDGFDVYEWCHDPTLALDSPFNGYAAWLRERDPAYLDELREKRWEAPARPESHMTTWAAERTIRFIDDSPADRPWFCMMSVFDPHDPYHDCPPSYAERIVATAIPEPIGWHDPPSPGPADIDAERCRSYIGQVDEYDLDRVMSMRRGYHGSVSLVDEQIGRVLDALEARGVADDTLVIFVSDHGDMLGDHRLLVKGAFFYDPCTRVPLMMRWPRRLPGGVVRDDLAQPNDLAATILAAAGIAPRRLHGMMPESHDLFAAEPQPREHAICHYFNSGVTRDKTYFDPPIHASMIRSGRHKLNAYWQAGGEPTLQCFDMADDPDERTDLSCDRATEPVRSQLLSSLRRSLASRGGSSIPPASPFASNPK